jgi:uncharacterized damage-inducible protein DinB
MTADELREHIRYSGWASRRTLDAALKLDAEQLHRDMSVSHKTVMDTLAHIHWAERAWLFRVLGSEVEKPTEALDIEWPRIQKRWEDWAASLTDADLARIVYYKTLKGDPTQTPVWQIVLHVVNHATLHRGQVVAMLRQLGAQPPATDLIFYYREQK